MAERHIGAGEGTSNPSLLGVRVGVGAGGDEAAGPPSICWLPWRKEPADFNTAVPMPPLRPAMTTQAGSGSEQL